MAKAKSRPKQNRRHTTRVKARHSGARQCPNMSEHLNMMFPHGDQMQMSAKSKATRQ